MDRDELQNESQLLNAQKRMLNFTEKILSQLFSMIDSQNSIEPIREQTAVQKRLLEHERSQLQIIRKNSISEDGIEGELKNRIII